MSEGPVDSGAPVADSIPAADIPTTPTPSAPASVPSTVPSGGGHPAWNEVLTHIPESLHANIRPVLEKWDQGVTQRLSEVQSRYAPFEQFQGTKPEQIQQAMQIYGLLNSDPKKLYEQMAEHFGYGDQGQEDGSFDPTDAPDLESDNPQIEALRQQQQQMQAYVQQQQQVDMDRQADAWLDAEQAKATAYLTQQGLQEDADWDYILNKAAMIGQQTNDIEGAVLKAAEAYVTKINALRSKPQASAQAPTVLPTTGGVPSSRVNVTDMDANARKKYGAELLASLMNDT